MCIILGLNGLDKCAPQERITRLRNFAWIVAGSVASRSVHLSRIAEKIPGTAKTLSRTQCVWRFLDDSAVWVREWYTPVARALLQDVVAHGMEVRLLTDGTKVGFGHQLLMVALAYRRRALPIAWTRLCGSRGHSSTAKQQALLAYIHGLLPAGAQVSIAGDSEFGAVAVLKQLDQWKWGYVMRQEGDTRVKLPDQHPWWRFGSLPQKGTRPRWFLMPS